MQKTDSLHAKKAEDNRKIVEEKEFFGDNNV